MSPDLREQVRETDLGVPDAAFLTHFHHDHTGGIDDLATFDHGERVPVRDLTVVPFPVAHGRPAFDTVGFAVSADGKTAVWAHDIEQFRPDMPAGDAYRDADLLFVEGSPLVCEGLFEDIGFDGGIASANADRTVLFHVNEYLDGSTETLRAEAAERGYELGRDFERYEV